VAAISDARILLRMLVHSSVLHVSGLVSLASFSDSRVTVLKETCGVPLEQMATLFEDVVDEKSEPPERQPLTRSRSPSPPRRDTESQIEPPEVKANESGGVLGMLFGSEITVSVPLP